MLSANSTHNVLNLNIVITVNISISLPNQSAFIQIVRIVLMKAIPAISITNTPTHDSVETAALVTPQTDRQITTTYE